MHNSLGFFDENITMNVNIENNRSAYFKQRNSLTVTMICEILNYNNNHEGDNLVKMQNFTQH